MLFWAVTLQVSIPKHHCRQVCQCCCHCVTIVCLQVLGKKERSLAALLTEYLGVFQDKQHQLDDWRVRYNAFLSPPWPQLAS